MNKLMTPALHLEEVLVLADRLANRSAAAGHRRGGRSLELLKLDCEGCEFDVLASPEARAVVQGVPWLIGEIHTEWMPSATSRAEVAAGAQGINAVEASVVSLMCSRAGRGGVDGCSVAQERMADIA